MANDYGLFFSRDNTVIRLPVNPEKFPVERGNENDDYNVLGLGPIMVPRLPSLKVISFSSFFPGRIAPYVLTSGDFKEPEFYIQFFESAMADKAPIRFTPVRYYEDGTPYMTQDEGLQVLVTQFDTEERGGETGDFYYDLELTEYKDYSPLTMKIEEPEKEEEPAAATTEPPREIPPAEITVGCTCIMNGKYYYSSYGDNPYGSTSNKRVKVSRMVTSDASRAYPIHITTESGGALGWTKKENLQVVSDK